MNLTLKNSLGQSVTLTGQEQNYQVLKVTGIDPGKAIVNTTSIVGVDGTRFNSARLPNRNIVINLKVCGNVDANRRDLYSKFPNKSQVTVTITTDMTATISGIIEGIICPIFEQTEIMQISILCDDPYFYGATWEFEDMFNLGTGELYSFDMVNNGEAGTGFKVDFYYDGQFDKITLLFGTAENLHAYGGLTIIFPDPRIKGVFSIDSENKTATNTEDGEQTIDLIPYFEFGSGFPVLPAGTSKCTVILDRGMATDFQTHVDVPTRIGGM